MSSILSRLAGWREEAHAKIAARLIRPEPAPGAPSERQRRDHDLSGMTPVALPETATDTHLYQTVTAVITKVLGGWVGGRVRTSAVKSIAERVATVVVERGWDLVNDTLNDPKIHKAAVNFVKQVLIEAAYFVGGRFGGLVMALGADYVAERIIHALSGQPDHLSTAPQVLTDREVEDARCEIGLSFSLSGHLE